jgi:hypothetical protein
MPVDPDPRGQVCPSFPLTDLPPDVQLLILSNLDLHTIQNLMNAIPATKELYLSYPSSILRGVLVSMDLQTRNLLLTTYNLVCIIQSAEEHPKPDLSNMDDFLAENLDTEEPQNIDFFGQDAAGALDTLCEIDAEVTDFVTQYAQDVYYTACKTHEAEAIVPPVSLSSTETHRIMRAFYRLKLFGVLFYDYTHRFDLDLKSSAYEYLDRFSAFELDELIAAYDSFFTRRRPFKPAHIHEDCPFLRTCVRPDIEDTRHCERCRGLCANIRVNNGFYNRPDSETLWTLLLKSRYTGVGTWAKPEYSLQTPIKIWHDDPEANEPNAGWLLWCKVRDGSSPNENEHVKGFRNLGYCFWDSERLEGWDDIFQEGWFSENRYCTSKVVSRQEGASIDWSLES